NTTTGTGLYIWNGDKWLPLINHVNYVYLLTDIRDGETYFTGNFGTAGIWMLENLRYVPKAAEGYEHNGTSASTAITDKYYVYPGVNMNPYDAGAAETGWDKSWGILYNWAGATNGRSLPSNDEADKAYDGTYTKVQGVCPDGWYLPSDMDWSDLEEVIAAATAGIYSTDGTVSLPSDFRTSTSSRNVPLGKKMKSTKDVYTTDTYTTNGSSKSAATGGFDALLVGNVFGGGSRNDFGLNTLFWSSSFNSGFNAWLRYLGCSYEGVDRGVSDWSALFSVRCKKD
ncbi:MAG: fibrobacter succinogenes major paralogous domain-containing protein, partial [Dysgonamonadaceae bacterium]|nr:fibrobacter succinogenes major paralogous domain-containing protein [Dysgonamonadaceae bacterium]